MTFHTSGPYAARETALKRAREAADRHQRVVCVFATHDESAAPYVIQFDGVAPGLAWDKVGHIYPNPAKSPFKRNRVIDVFASTDRTLRNARVGGWIQQNESEADRDNVIGRQRRYAIRIGEKSMMMHNERVTLYSYVVRINPKYSVPDANA